MQRPCAPALERDSELLGQLLGRERSSLTDRKRRPHDRVDDGGVELAAGALPQHAARGLVIEPRRVRAPTGHRHVCVDHRQDPRLKGDFRTHQTAWVAHAIRALAVAEDPLTDVGEATGLTEQTRPEFGQAAYRAALLSGERTLLVADLRRDLIASHRAHERREANPGELNLT